MIIITYSNWYNIHDHKGNFDPIFKKLFGAGAEFIGCFIGSFCHAKVKIMSTRDFLKFKSHIPTKGLIAMEGHFDIIDKMTLGVNDFSNALSEIHSRAIKDGEELIIIKKNGCYIGASKKKPNP